MRAFMQSGGAIRALLLILVATFGLVVHRAGFTEQSTIDLTGRHLVFDDEFDTLSVSAHDPATRWSAHTPWNGDFGQARFSDPEHNFPFAIRDGILNITAAKGANGQWQSGLLSSSSGAGRGFTARYGYFEMRAQFPGGPGTWPAFWLDSIPPPGSSDRSVEIDIVEQYGKFPAAFNSTVTLWDHANPQQTRSNLHINRVTSGAMSSGFHTYGADVTPKWVIFYFDRREVWRTPTPVEHKDGLDVLVDLGLGGGWPIDGTPDPSTMKVDYIRVYSEAVGRTELH